MESEKMDKNIPLQKLIWQILPEVWVVQLIAGVFLAVSTNLIGLLAYALLSMRDAALTTANIKGVLLSWQGILLILLFVVATLIFITIEFFATIILLDDILKGRQENVFKATFSSIRRAFAALPRFLSFVGFRIMLYITVALPMIGMRFLMTFNSLFRIPNFIMEPIKASSVLSTLYVVLIIVLVILVLRYSLAIHGILIDNMKAKEARKYSRELIRKNRKAYFLGILQLFLVLGAIYVGAWLVFRYLPAAVIAAIGEENLKASMQTENYHVFMILIVLGGVILFELVQTMLVSCFLLRFSRFYEDFSTGQTRTSYIPRTTPGKNMPFVVSMIALGIFLVGYSFYCGRNFYDVIPETGHTRVIAHRTGGVLASENSVEGVEQAILHGCEGSETDTRRTTDGQYTINHDDTFKRLTGVNKKPEEMSSEEISELQIKDTTGSGALLPVPMLEDLLDASTGKVRLYIELKGPSADEQMVDDIVKMVKEKYNVDDVALISLKYDVIQYAETHYPEFLTGVLMFDGYGNLEEMDCDIIMMEEDMLTAEVIEELHQAGKQAAAWTVNTKDGLRRALSLGADALITDQPEVANSMITEVNNRMDLEILEDYLYYDLHLI